MSESPVWPIQKHTHTHNTLPTSFHLKKVSKGFFVFFVLWVFLFFWNWPCFCQITNIHTINWIFLNISKRRLSEEQLRKDMEANCCSLKPYIFTYSAYVSISRRASWIWSFTKILSTFGYHITTCALEPQWPSRSLSFGLQSIPEPRYLQFPSLCQNFSQPHRQKGCWSLVVRTGGSFLAMPPQSTRL